MRKMFAVMKREYLQAVKKKMFIIMTLLFPFLMAALMVIPGLIAAKGMGSKRIAVLDGTGKLQPAYTRPNDVEKKNDTAQQEARKALSGRSQPELPTQIKVEYVNQAGAANADAALKPYLERMTRDDDAPDKLEGVFVIPAKAATDQETPLTFYSRSSTDFITQERLGKLANKSLQRSRLSDNGVSPELVDNLLRDLRVDAVQLSRTGGKKTGGELNFVVAFIFGALLMLPSLVYGQETMRGIVQEKSDRVVEVLISSVTPRELLTGKIVGVAAVGLTQIFVWLTMIAIAGGSAVATASMADINLTQFIRPSVFFYFFVFFILAYMTYVCIYAIAGAVCNSEKEAQQFVMPIMMVMMMPWFLMMPIVLNPDAPFAIGFSLAPVFGPITMFVRTLVTEPPMWHVLVSIAVSIATIAAFFWITAKIFRVGILSYGKRPTLPELWRWLKVA
ncbi:MAG: type transport system permease protein [Acidobacteriota bacterium]|nr:type transport system permease protein [Acidobacteriota bacterium]